MQLVVSRTAHLVALVMSLAGDKPTVKHFPAFQGDRLFPGFYVYASPEIWRYNSTADKAGVFRS